ncbi:MAG: MMPL family transporter, partial [Pseudomonadota bacterium]
MAFAAAFPRATLCGLAGLVAIAAYAATGLGVDTDSSRMISPELQSQKAAQVLNEKFPSLKSAIIVTVTADDADTADLIVADLSAQLRATTATIASVFAASDDPYLRAHGFLYRDEDDLDAMFERLSRSANLLAHLRSDQSIDGFARALIEALDLAERAEIGEDALVRLLAEASSVLEAHALKRARNFSWSTVLEDEPSGIVTRLIAVKPVLDHQRLSPARPALATIEAAIAAIDEDRLDGVQIRVTGEPALRAEELRSVAGTIWISLLLSLVLVGALLRWGLRHWGPVLLALGVLVISLVLTSGAAALTVGALNLISIAFIVLMVGLGIDFAVHVLAHIAELRFHATPPKEALRLTGLRSGRALMTCAITTAAAFLAFTVTDFHGMAQLGVIGALGVLIAWSVALFFIPACLALRPGLVGARAPMTVPLRTGAAGPAVIVLLIGAAAIWPALQARFDTDPMGLRDPGAQSVQA